MKNNNRKPQVGVGIIASGELVFHIPGVLGDYATLCGLDGGLDGDDEITDQSPSHSTGKITCWQCKMIWDAAKQFTLRDFSVKLLREGYGGG